MSDTISWYYPDQLHDEHGYPTNDALDYIKNWALIFKRDSDTKQGEFFGKNKLEELISYIKDLWWYGDDGVVYEDGLLELHTMGWSGNEEIISELKDTDLWLMKFKAHLAGGHYYFKIDSDSEHDWHIVKSKDI
jgi:hypothetical protein